MVVVIQSAMVSQFCVGPTFNRWFLKIVQVTIKVSSMHSSTKLHNWELQWCSASLGKVVIAMINANTLLIHVDLIVFSATEQLIELHIIAIKSLPTCLYGSLVI